MRILSQESLELYYDVPYEQVCLSVVPIYSDQYRILANSPSNTLRDTQIMETYSSKEKSEKAMEMLRKAYSPLLIIKDLGDRIEADIKPNDWEIQRTEPYGVRENFYFRFPRDDEVEG